MTQPDYDNLTTTGRLNAPDAPEHAYPLDGMTAAELGACLAADYDVWCPEQSEDACSYKYNGRQPLRDYQMGMLLVYPECEACGCTLVVGP